MKKENILNKILICAYIIIALLAINTIILFASNVKITSDSKTNEETTGNTEYDVSMFDSVDLEQTIKLFDSEETQIIYIGRSTCGYCVKFLPVLQKAQKEFGYKTKYLDITTITTTEQQNALLAKDNDESFLATNFGSTPMVILVKDGKLVKGWVGYSEYDEFAKFLTDNGITKE